MYENQTNIKHKRTQSIINTQLMDGLMDHTLYKSTGYTPVKNYFRLWILAEVEQQLLFG